MPPHLYWGLVQLVERQILTLEVKGSSPLPPAKLIADNGVTFLIGRCSRNAKMCRTYELPKVRASWMETRYKSPKKNRTWAFKVAIV